MSRRALPRALRVRQVLRPTVAARRAHGRTGGAAGTEVSDRAALALVRMLEGGGVAVAAGGALRALAGEAQLARPHKPQMISNFTNMRRFKP